MKRKKIKLPSRFIRVDSASKTVAVRGKGGKFKGRKKVRGKGDTTHARRVVRDVDIDGDKKPDFFGGTILGRTAKVRASRRAKGYQRRI